MRPGRVERAVRTARADAAVLVLALAATSDLYRGQ